LSEYFTFFEERKKGWHSVDKTRSLNWGVIDLRAIIPAEYKLDIYKISHVTMVPEPTTMLHLGFGLIGLAAGSRRFKK
jgi:hypothetical protein